MKKFFKLYAGPGYPVDPKLEAERQAARSWVINPAWESAEFDYEFGQFDSINIGPHPVIVSGSPASVHRFLSCCETLLKGTN